MAKILLEKSGLFIDILESYAETPQTILQKILTIDGRGSGLDADNLGGVNYSQYALRSDIYDKNTIDTNFLNIKSSTPVNITTPLNIVGYPNIIGGQTSITGKTTFAGGVEFINSSIKFNTIPKQIQDALNTKATKEELKFNYDNLELICSRKSDIDYVEDRLKNFLELSEDDKLTNIDTNSFMRCDKRSVQLTHNYSNQPNSIIDLAMGNNFIWEVDSTASNGLKLTLNNGIMGQSGVIKIINANKITSIDSRCKFNFQVSFQATEYFAYFCFSDSEILLNKL